MERERSILPARTRGELNRRFGAHELNRSRLRNKQPVEDHRDLYGELPTVLRRICGIYLEWMKASQPEAVIGEVFGHNHRSRSLLVSASPTGCMLTSSSGFPFIKIRILCSINSSTMIGNFPAVVLKEPQPVINSSWVTNCRFSRIIDRKMSTCNRLDLESLGSWLTLYAQKLSGHCFQPSQRPGNVWA